MNIFQIIRPALRNQFIWLSALALIILLLSGIADPFAIVMAYFLETFIIGLFHFFKMILVSRRSMTQRLNPGKNPWYLIPFFLFHYSFFIVVQSIFVFVIFQFADSNIRGPFDLISNYLYVLGYKGIGYGLLVMILFMLLHNYYSFYRNNAYHLHTVDSLFFQPYLRIFIQQFTVIMAMFFVAFVSSGTIAALILILLRLLLICLEFF